MRGVIWSVLVAVLLGGFTVAAAQLPPEIMADRYLLRAERLMAEKDYKAALKAMNKIVALQKEHDLTLPEKFHYRYARVAFSAGSIKTAMDSVNKYLAATGRKGEFYREALELLDQVEPIQTLLDEYEYPNQVERLIAEKDYEAALQAMNKIVALQKEHDFTLPKEFRSKYAQLERFTQPCTGQPEGTACWMEVANQPGCYVWDDYLYTDETVTWTAECSGGLAQGEGTLTWAGSNENSGTGRLQDGQRHGHWVLRGEDGTVFKGPYVDGKRHGHWVLRYANGNVAEGPYVEGKQHGDWVLRYANGNVVEVTMVEGKAGHWVERFADGRVDEGPMVEGKQHGHWVERFADGNVAEGPYVEGKKHGHWVVRFAIGGVLEGPYVEGKQHGDWLFRYANGNVVEVTMVEGKAGNWVERFADGRVDEGPMVEGKHHGHWVLRFADGNVAEGPYVEGKKHGHWVMRLAIGGVLEGPYVEGKQHGHWVFRWGGEKIKYTYKNGEIIKIK